LRLWSFNDYGRHNNQASDGRYLSMTKEIGNLHDEHSITSAVFLRNDGNKILTNSTDGAMQLIDIRMMKAVKRFEDSEYFPAGLY